MTVVLDTGEVARLMHERGYRSMADLARQAQMDPQRFRDLMRGRRGGLTLKTLGRIGYALECDPRKLLKLEKAKSEAAYSS